jgi:hypothetical protein
MVYFRVKHSHSHSHSHSHGHSQSSTHSNIGDGSRLSSSSWPQISALHRKDMFVDLHGVKEALLS